MNRNFWIGGGITLALMLPMFVVYAQTPPTPPILQSFSSTTSSGTYGPGRIINVRASYNKALGIGSTITITLNNGVSQTLSTISGSSLSATYTVGATGSNEDSADLTISSITSESVKDTANNLRTNSSVPSGTKNLGGSKNIVIDTKAPNIRIAPLKSAHTTAQNITLTAGILVLRPEPNPAVFHPEPSSTRIFYTVTSDGSVPSTPTVNSTRYTSRIAAPLNVVTTIKAIARDAAGNLGDVHNARYVVENVKPTLISILPTTLAGTYGVGSLINFEAIYSEPLRFPNPLYPAPPNRLSIILNTVPPRTVLLEGPSENAKNSLTGTYTVQIGDAVVSGGNLAVVRIVTSPSAVRELVGDFAGNIRNDSTLPSAPLSGIVINTAPPADTTPPTVSSFSPAPNATSVALGENLVIAFSEPVTAVVGKKIRIEEGTGTNTFLAIDADHDLISVSGNIVTINPTSNLSNGKAYYVTIDPGAFRDAAGNTYAGISNTTTWNFATAVAADTIAPLILTLIRSLSNAIVPHGQIFVASLTGNRLPPCGQWTLIGPNGPIPLGAANFTGGLPGGIAPC